MPIRCVNGLFQQATGIKGAKDCKAVLETELAVIYIEKNNYSNENGNHLGEKIEKGNEDKTIRKDKER